MRVYEELFIVKQNAPEEEVDASLGQLKELIKYNEGVYVLFQFSSSPELVKEIERRMRVTDMVIKFITVRIDEKTKKIEKRKKQRDKRAARRPPPPPMASPMQPAPGPSAPAGPSLPAAPAMPAPAAPAAPEAGAVAAVAETKES